MTIQMLAAWNGLDEHSIQSLPSAEESRLVGLGLARYYTVGMDGQSDPIARINDRLTSKARRLYSMMRPSTIHPSPPTISYSLTAPAGRRMLPWREDATVVGAVPIYNESAGVLDLQSRANMSGIDVLHSGTSLTYQWRTEEATKERVMVYVDGMPCMASPATPSVTTVANTSCFVTLTFASASVRRVEILVNSSNRASSIILGLGDSIQAAPKRSTVALVGDSFSASSAAIESASQGITANLQMMLDVNVCASAFGGTGYVTAGSFSVFGDQSRVASIGLIQPEALVIMGSVNDDGKSGIEQAAISTIEAYRLACPNTKIIIFGPQPSTATATLSANRLANNQAVKRAADYCGVSFVDMIGNADPLTAPTRPFASFTTFLPGERVTHLGSVWELDSTSAKQFPASGAPGFATGTYNDWKLKTFDYFGTGQVGSVVGDGTRDTYLHSDGVHPTAVACKSLARRLALAVLDDVF